MIDPSRTREQMLRDLQATADVLSEPNRELEAFQNDEAMVVLEGPDAPGLLGQLDPLLRNRYSSLPLDRLTRDLLAPLKKATGNAWKHGNRKDPAKRVVVKLVATRRGVLIEVSDEGDGFDVAGVLDRLGSVSKYFNHHGSGFKHFARARSVISFADSGRTFLLRFLIDDEARRAVEAPSDTATIPPADALRSILAQQVRAFREGRSTIVSCRQLADDDLPAALDAAYELEVVNGGPPRRVMLSARTVSVRGARIERAATRRLREVFASHGNWLHAPTPVAGLRPAGLVLYPFVASRDLRDHLHAVDATVVIDVVTRIGSGLRLLHDTTIGAPRVTRRHELARLGRAFERARVTLDRTPERARRAQACFDVTAARVRQLSMWPEATIHGSLGWNFMLVEGDQLHWIGFEDCRVSHPGVDVGAFLLDLRRNFLLRAKADPAIYPRALAAFERAYFGTRAPAWRPNLDLFTALAMAPRLERLLRRAESKWEAKVDVLIDEWERLLVAGQQQESSQGS